MIERKDVKVDLLIPFSETGNQLGYGSGIFSRRNEIFKSTMTYVGFSRGRSSVKFSFVDVAGRSYEMFAKDFDGLIKLLPVNTEIEGNWAFRKRGANFGLSYVTD